MVFPVGCCPVVGRGRHGGAGCPGTVQVRLWTWGAGARRLVEALARRGHTVLGIDVSPAAVISTARRGSHAHSGSVFAPVQDEGTWDTALLIDGNIGIGGHPPPSSSCAASTTLYALQGYYSWKPQLARWTSGAGSRSTPADVRSARSSPATVGTQAWSGTAGSAAGPPSSRGPASWASVTSPFCGPAPEPGPPRVPAACVARSARARRSPRR